MKVEKLKIKNYRTLENLELDFPDFYVALSGKNNAGKTSLMKIMRMFLSDDSVYDPFVGDAPSVSFKNDYPHWKLKDENKEDIHIEITLRISREADKGLFKFMETFAKLDFDKAESICARLSRRYSENSSSAKLDLKLHDQEITDHYVIEEIHKKLRSSKSFFFHNSTQSRNGFYAMRHGISSYLGEFSEEDKEKIKKAKTTLYNKIRSAASGHKTEIHQLLGRLDEKYDVNISLPTLDFESFPFGISLGGKDENVPLEEWGSGTQNRTMILLALLRAQKVKEYSSESDKITPILLVEEPECFLHPSAQAEFGRVIRDLANEFKVQVIATTHSPYMLSVEKPESNILLEREIKGKKHFGAQQIETNGEDWMQPFANALGISNTAFDSWKNVVFQGAEELILVEGESDIKYLENLRDRKVHGSNALEFEGEFFAYGGSGFLSNPVLLKFIINRFKTVIVTYDLDSASKAEKTLNSLSLIKHKDYFPIGLSAPGKKDIEGLVPDRIKALAYAENPELVTAATSADKEKNSARNSLKSNILAKYNEVAKVENEDFAEFYKLTTKLNKSLRASRK
ncbi:MAG: ATP-dependent nuclease [Akkermansiaceae bacterium]